MRADADVRANEVAGEIAELLGIGFLQIPDWNDREGTITLNIEQARRLLGLGRMALDSVETSVVG